VCHDAADLVSANLAYFASAEAVYNPHPGPHPHDVPPPAVSCTECHGMGQDITITALELGTGSGGGIYNTNSSSPTLVNCTFWPTSPVPAAGGMFNDASSSATVTNCILWGDILSNETPSEIEGDAATVTYSCVQGGYAGTGNIADDPSFVDAENGNLRLNPDSLCINTGTPDGAPGTDIRGVPRAQGSGFDMGVYEYYNFAITTQPQSLTVNESDPASFSVEVSGGLGSISYQWRWDGNDIENENASVYTIESAQMGNKESYTCLVRTTTMNLFRTPPP